MASPAVPGSTTRVPRLGGQCVFSSAPSPLLPEKVLSLTLQKWVGATFPGIWRLRPAWAAPTCCILPPFMEKEVSRWGTTPTPLENVTLLLLEQFLLAAGKIGTKRRSWALDVQSEASLYLLYQRGDGVMPPHSVATSNQPHE